MSSYTVVNSRADAFRLVCDLAQKAAVEPDADVEYLSEVLTLAMISFRSCVEALSAYEKELREVRAKLETARRALDWYAAEKHYDNVCDTISDPTFTFRDHDGDVRVEDGTRARTALVEIGAASCSSIK